MSEDTLPKIALTVKGLENVVLVAHELPNIPSEAIPGIIEHLRDIGVDAAKTTLDKTATSEKSTGITSLLMTGLIDQMENDYVINIGPDTRGLGTDEDYPRFLSMSTGPVTMNRPVQLLPYPLRFGFNPLGRWRFIGIRPRIEGHPWMEGTRDAILNEMTRLYGKELYRLISELGKKVKRLSLEGQIGE